MPQLSPLTHEEAVEFILMASIMDDAALVRLGTLIWGVLAARHSENAQECVDYFRRITSNERVESVIRHNWDGMRRTHLQAMKVLDALDSRVPPGAANAP